MASYRITSSGLAFVLFTTIISNTLATVTLTTSGQAATVSNGIVSIDFKADATVSSVKVNGRNIASTKAKSFYLDWDAKGVFNPNKLTVVENANSRAHFFWTQPGSSGVFKVELHYAMVDGLSGIYSWAKYTNDQGGSISVGETRTIYRFDAAVLTQGTNYARQGTLPLYDYLNQQTKIQDETWQLPDGSYYTKYDYAGYFRQTPYHGVYGNGHGAFVITPNHDYLAGGPLRQDLLVHQDSLIANYFVSSHFGATGLTAPAGWSHIYGPWLLYFNTGSDSEIISDVVRRAQQEANSWPYNFVGDNDEYPTSRGSISGSVIGQKKAAIAVWDSDEDFDVQALGYLYSAETDGSGSYSISKVRPGNYKVVAYPLAGQGSENVATASVSVSAGGRATVPELNLPEPQNIIWSIGQTNHRSDEFKYSKEPRNYVYETLPPETLTFTIGQSDPPNDWYYAQTKPGTWTIKYEDTQDGKPRNLRVALAAASNKPHMIVSVNGHKVSDLYYGNDQSVYRSAMQSGKFYSNMFQVNNAQVVTGTNTLTIQISKGQFMYDAISLQRV